MSFILEAKKKSENKDQRASPTQSKWTTGRLTVTWTISLLIISSITWVTLNIFSGSKNTKIEPTETTPPDSQKNLPADLKLTVTNPNSNQITLANSNSLSSNSSKDFDDLKITSHIYTQDPSQRAIFIEDQVYRIGDRYKSAEIRAIDQDGFVLRVNHERYIEDVYIPLADNWSTR